MSLSLLPDTLTTIRDLMPQPTPEHLKSILAPKIAEAESEVQRIIAEENTIRVQLDSKLTEMSVASAALQRYLAAATDIDSQLFQG